MATQETARPQSGGAFLTAIVVIVLVGLAVAVVWNVLRDEQDRAIFYARQTAQAVAPEPTQPARPTAPPAPISAPIVAQTVPEGAAPQNVAPQPAQAAPVGEAAPAPRPLIIVHHQSDDGHQVITGSGACAVGGSVARRCGK